MLRTSLTLIALFALLSLPLSHPVLAQPKDNDVVTQPAPAASPDLKKAIAAQDKKYEKNAADAATLEKIDRQNQQSKWTRKQKMWLVLGIIGTAALVFVLIKYGKDCLRTEPAGCSWNEEGCRCVEYVQNL